MNHDGNQAGESDTQVRVEDAVLHRVRERMLGHFEGGREISICELLRAFPEKHWDMVVREYVALLPEEDAGEEESPGADGAGPEPPSGLSRYRTQRELGRGGQATVHLAVDLRLHRNVALKLLRNPGPGSESLKTRFLREAEVASQLDHPGICTVFDAGVDGEISYIAMQYLQGETLARRVARAAEASSAATAPTIDGELTDLESPGFASSPPSTTVMERGEVMRVVEIIEEVAGALHAAHEAGILHRDVKPANIMIEPDGHPVLTDFGLARQEDSDLPTLTRTGELFGTPAYMSPEQLTHQVIHLDRRSDVWSLGATLYECLTLHRPFAGATREQLYMRILGSEPPDPRRLNPAIPRDLEVILETALQKNRERRYGSAIDLAEDLRRLRQGEPIRARPVPPLGRALRWVRRHPARATVAALLMMLMAAVGFAAARWPEYRRGMELTRSQQVEEALEAGYLQLGHGSSRRAREAFREALEIRPAPEAVAGLAFALIRGREPEAALEVLEDHEEVLQRHPELGWVQVAAARRQGRDAEAEHLAARLGPPRGALAWFLVGSEEMGRGHDGEPEAFGRAADAFRRAATIDARSLHLFEWAHAVGHIEDEATGRMLAEALTLRWPDSARAWFWAAFAIQSDPETVITYLQEHALAIDSERFTTHNNLGLAFWKLGRLDEASEAYQEAIRLDPDQAICHHNLGVVCKQQGRFGEAIDSLRRSIELDPEFVETYRVLAGALKSIGDFDGAIASYRRAIEVDPNDVISHVHLGEYLRRKGDIDGAIATCQAAIELDPQRAGAHLNLGVALWEKGHRRDALSHVLEAVRLDPGLAIAHYNLGRMLLEEGRLEECIGSLSKAISLEPDLPFAHRELGVARLRQGDAAAAERSFRRTIALDPDHRSAHHDLGNALIRQGRIEECVESYRRAIELEPNEARTHRYLAGALRDLGQIDQAIESYRRAIELDGSDLRTYNKLGIALLKQEAFDGAIDAFRSAIERDPGYAEAHCNLGRALRRTGNLPDAVASLRRGHELGVLRGAEWRYPSAQWLASAALEWARELDDTGATDTVVEVLRECAGYFPKSTRLRRELERLEGNLKR